jgi:hypothetical protein
VDCGELVSIAAFALRMGSASSPTREMMDHTARNNNPEIFMNVLEPPIENLNADSQARFAP